METSTDLLLGIFLIISGFALSVLNLKRLVKHKNASFHSVLMSENLLLTCIGATFITRAFFQYNPTNLKMNLVEERRNILNIENSGSEEMACNFKSILMSYGPFILSLVNSFVSLVIDNYIHYRILEDSKEMDDAITVRDIGERSRRIDINKIKHNFSYLKKYFLIIAAALQWLTPIIVGVSMYFIGVKEQDVSTDNMRSIEESCVTMLSMKTFNCTPGMEFNESLQLRNVLDSVKSNFTHENMPRQNSSDVQSVVNKVYDIVKKYKLNHTNFNITSQIIHRRNKLIPSNCFKMCYADTKSLLSYMFGIIVFSYFVPVTISIVILTKIHVMDGKNSQKTHVNRELLYNILFWTPVMFDTFITLIYCSHSMNGMRTSIFNVIANVYQVVKNFFNSKYLSRNTVAPV